MKFIDLFAGIGGFHLGLKNASPEFECVYSNEWDKYANSIYKKHFGSCDQRDIREVEAGDIPDHDLLVGGFPCQSFSIAGKRGGFSDTRGTLFFEISRIVREKQPRLLLLENVKGLLSHDKGRTFYTIIATLDELGYDCQWQVLNSKDFGVPQNRERVFIVGHLRGTPRPEVFPIIGANKKDTRNTGEDLSYTIDANYHKGTNTLSKGRRQLIQLNHPKHSNDRIYSTEGLSPTLNTMQGGMRQPFVASVLTPDRLKKRQNGRRIKENGEPSFTLTAQDKHGIYDGVKIRRLTPTECSRLQSFPDDWTKHGVENATPEMYNKGYANAQKENAIKVLRTLRKAASSDKRKGWGFTKSIALFEKEILQPQLYAKSLQGNLEERGITPTRELQSEAVDSCDRMFEVWNEEKLRYSPQGQKQIEQCLEQLRGIVSRMPHKNTQERGWMESSKEKQGQERQIFFSWISDTQRYKCLGNAVTTNVITEIAKRLI
jgi:DNA (cytosine-5)-methyltransferase 1